MYLGIVKRKAKSGPVPVTPITPCELCGAIDCRDEFGAGSRKAADEKPKTSRAGRAHHQKPIPQNTAGGGNAGEADDSTEYGSDEYGSESIGW